MKFEDLITGVMGLRNHDEIDAIFDALKVARKRGNALTALSLKVGQNVMVVQKTKKTPGVIVKVNRTRCVVDMNGSRYNVPNSMLAAA